MNKPKYVLFYFEGGRVFGTFYDSEEELLEGLIEDVELFPEDLVGYTITKIEKNSQGRIIFYAEKVKRG
jgi:hypothetical protein